ncbi:thiamine-phosphate pyrophosphorylase [Bordetella pertussis]|nr:thiamine-phosphate pyrophosphorylase [Bordetella pertussis]
MRAQAGAGLLLGVSCYNDLVAQAGADSAAVISGLFEAPDIQAAARACAAAFSVNP